MTGLGSANKQNQPPRAQAPYRLATQQDLEELEKELMTVETNLDAQIADLTTSVQNETTVSNSALTLIQGISAQIAAAVAAASSAGATTTQLQALSNLQATLDDNDTTLAAAVTANTSAATTAGGSGSGPSPSPSISAKVAAAKASGN